MMKDTFFKGQNLNTEWVASQTEEAFVTHATKNNLFENEADAKKAHAACKKTKAEEEKAETK